MSNDRAIAARRAPAAGGLGRAAPPRSDARPDRPRSLAAAAGPLGFAALLACLPALAPGIRAAGPHRGLAPTEPDERCLRCHAVESEALARAMAVELVGPHGSPRARRVDDPPAESTLRGRAARDEQASPAGASQGGVAPATSARGLDPRAPLVADWMVADPRACVRCHPVRPSRR